MSGVFVRKGHPKKKWLLEGRPREHVRWAFRLFVVSFIMFFVFSLFFYFTFVMAGGFAGSRVYSIFGVIPVNLAVYLFLLTLGVWMGGWAILWGKRDSKRPKSFVWVSWAIPLGLVWVWISILVMVSLGVSSSVINLVSFIPPLIMAVLVPQLFVQELLAGKEKTISKLSVGLGLGSIAVWGVGSSVNSAALPLVEILLPAYFGLLVIEYLSIHLRINGPDF